LIEARNLMKVYKPKKGVPVHALNDVSVKLPDKGMVFILGKSGSGKSTLLNVLGGLDSVDTGEIVIKGVSAKDFKQAHYDSYRNTYVGFIFQEYNVLEEFTVGANVALAIELQGRKPTNEEINKILKEVDLDGYGNRKPNELSGGQKQRVAIARALVKNPEIIMADEPTGALDSVTGRQVFDTLKSLSKDKLVLIVSHDREFSELYADRIIELADGKIISDVEKIGDAAPVPAEEKPLSYSGNEIEIKKGYVLTQADLKAINDYIANLSNNAKMVIKGELRPDYVQRERGEFAPTDESKIVVEKDNNFKLIKSKLSLKNAFKIGAGGLKHKKFRLVFTIFLSFIAFALFGLADTVASYDNVGTAITSLIDSNIDYASFQKKIDGNSRDYLLSDADIAKINEHSGVTVMGVYKELYYDINFSRHLQTDDSQVEHKLEALYVDKFSGFAEITESELARYGYELTGTMPERGKKEIAISKYIYESFAEAGFTYLDANNDEVTKEINSPNDIIGMVMKIERYGDYTITGVIDTKFDISRYNALLDTESTDAAAMMLQMALSSELETTQKYSMNCVAFVSPGTIASIKSSNNEIGQEYNNFANMDITDRPKDYNGNDWDSFTNLYISRIEKLSNYSMPIAWLNGEKTSLATGEFILPMNIINDMMSDNSIDWWNSSVLKGYEKTLYDKGMNGDNIPWQVYVSSLDGVISCYYEIAAFKYASEMEIGDSIYNEIKTFLVESNFYDATSIDNFSKEQLINIYVDYCEWDTANEARADAYLDDVIERYGLEGEIIKLRDKNLSCTVEYNNSIYESYSYAAMRKSDFINSYSNIIMQYYAYTHFDEAKAYYLEKHPDAVFTQAEAAAQGKSYAYFYDIINEYLDSFYVEELGGGRMLNDEMRAYTFNIFAPMVIDTFDLEGLKVRINIYSPKREELEYDFKLVGIAESTNRNSFGILSDELYTKLLGGNADGIYAFAVAPMPSSRSGIERVVEFSYEEFDNDLTFGLANSVTYELDMIDDILDTLGQVFLYVGLALAVFASLMLSNFIATSVSLKKQEIGILRAIGSRSNDVFRIFFAEAFIIAMINFTLAIVTTGVAATVINSVLRDDVGILITILSFGIRQVGLLLAVSLFVAAVSTFFPVKKIASKKPIDAIRKR